MLTLTPRIAGPVALTVWNDGRLSIKAEIIVCELDRAPHAASQLSEVEFLHVKWGMAGSKVLTLSPGDSRTSRPFFVDGDKPLFVAYGEGENLLSCNFELRASVSLETLPGG